MTAIDVSCRFIPGVRRLRLPELTGFDEQLVVDTHTATAIRLIDRLLTQVDSPPKASALTASDRDRLLAALYEHTFGPRIQSTTHCADCDQPFDLEFPVEQLRGTLDTPSDDDGVSQPDGTFRTRNGVRFRLPTGEDEVAASAVAPGEAVRVLIDRCVLDPGADASIEALEDALEEVAPVLDVDLNAVCPECGQVQTVHFDMQFYLLRAIEQSRAQVARDAHLLATTYGWSYHEILGLPRSMRRTFVGLIEAERSSRHRVFA